MDEQITLIIEDSEPQREALALALARRGLPARVAATADEARAVIKELGERLAVLVLDMRLEDPGDPTITGANLGLEVVASKPRRLPEFLILSAYSLLEYYKLAVQLGAAAYLPKEGTRIEPAIRHIRAMLIRRNLSLDDAKVSERVTQIAEASQWLSEAAAKFCREVMVPVLTAYLGAPYVICINDDHDTQIINDGAELLPALRHLYEELENLTHGQVAAQPWTLNEDTLLELTGGAAAGATWAKNLIGASFLPLSVGPQIRITVGVLRGTQPLAEEPRELVAILAQYLQRSVLEPLLCTLAQCIKSKARREAKLLSHSCSYIAQEQLGILAQAQQLGSIATDSEAFQQLMALAGALRDTGQTLMLLEDDRPRVAGAPVTMRQLIQTALEDLPDPAQAGRFHLAKGDCEVVAAARDDLFIAVARILQWFAQRLAAAPSGRAPMVHIACGTDKGAFVSFTDNSPRLNEQSRQRLFAPFAQPVPAAGKELEGPGLHFPLYLAKTLIELKLNGSLVDASDELPGEVGHQLVMRFPT